VQSPTGFNQAEQRMQTIEKTIEVERPVRAAYDQWTRFQDFPQFMEGIKEVRKFDDTYLRWVAEIGGKAKQWDAEIVDQVPGKRIQWRSTTGTENSGTVTFVSLTPTKTRVILYLSYDPKGFFENLGDNLGMVSAKVASDLNRFKTFTESRSVPIENGHFSEAVVPGNP
jgi:uncharacterized membrane protein